MCSGDPERSPKSTLLSLCHDWISSEFSWQKLGQWALLFPCNHVADTHTQTLITIDSVCVIFLITLFTYLFFKYFSPDSG